MLPVLVVPAMPMMQQGFRPAAAVLGQGLLQRRQVDPEQLVLGQLAQLAAAEAQQVDGLVEAVVPLPRDVEGEPGHLGAGRVEALHLARGCGPGPRLMASFRPVMLAREPPAVKVPKLFSGRPNRSHSQRITRFSMAVPEGAWRQEAAFWFMAAARDSAKTATGSGAGFIMPK